MFPVNVTITSQFNKCPRESDNYDKWNISYLFVIRFYLFCCSRSFDWKLSCLNLVPGALRTNWKLSRIPTSVTQQQPSSEQWRRKRGQLLSAQETSWQWTKRQGKSQLRRLVTITSKKVITLSFIVIDVSTSNPSSPLTITISVLSNLMTSYEDNYLT